MNIYRMMWITRKITVNLIKPITGLMILIAGLPCLAWDEEDLNQITPEEIIEKAKEYANYRFYLNDSNLTARTGEYLGSKIVITPFSQSGNYQGIPYKWGGNDSIQSFQQGLQAGKKAGDICRPPSQNCQGHSTSSEAVGVDTSGFISQVWGLGRKYSTHTLPSISTPLSSMNELQPGDMILKVGHAMLFSHQKDGRFYVYEPSHQRGKVALYYYTASQLTGYQAYRYNGIATESACYECRCSTESELLRQAEQHFKAFRITKGAGATALTCYRAALKKNRHNAEALAGLEKIEVYYFARIRSALDRENEYEEQKYLVRLCRVNPKSAYLAALNIQCPFDYGLIPKIAAEIGLEVALLHAVIETESGYNPKAVSHKGAVGLMQLMPATAKRFGVTNRYDPTQNLYGGARYLHYLLDLFNNNLELAVAAYNAGEGNVTKYGNQIPPFRETQGYVKKVMRLYKAYRRD
jgi:soluble lytic murein transglycosylase-like protein